MTNKNGYFEGIVYRYYIVTPEGTEISYVGQTTDEKKRKSCWNSTKSSYGGKKIDEARRSYGLAAFQYEVLEIVTAETLGKLKNMLAESEAYSIKSFNSVNEGFNSSFGKGTKGMNFSEETRRKIAKAHEKYEVIVTDTTTGREMLFSSMSEAARMLDIRPSNIFYYLHMGIEKHGYKIEKAA